MRMSTTICVAADPRPADYGQRASRGSSPFREYPGVEYENFPLPPDYQEKTEWVFARLMYPALPSYGFRGNPDWKHGNANWTIDYPRSDRHLSEAIRRLTRIQRALRRTACRSRRRRRCFQLSLALRGRSRLLESHRPIR